jgi:hypothetical protein
MPSPTEFPPDFDPRLHAPRPDFDPFAGAWSGPDFTDPELDGMDLGGMDLEDQIDSGLDKRGTLLAASDRAQVLERARALTGDRDALLAALGRRTREAVARCERTHAGRS